MAAVLVSLLQPAYPAQSENLADSAVPESVVFVLPVDVPAGTSRVRLIVRDAGTGRMGTVDVKP